MDGIDPDLVDRARLALEGTPGILSVSRLQLRWVGHRLHGAATVRVADAPLSLVERSLHDAEHRVGHALPHVDDFVVRAVTT